MKTNILLFNPPFKDYIIRDNYCCFTSKASYLWPPVDFLYLSAILKDKKINLKVIDAVAENISWKKSFNQIFNFNPRIIICLTGTVSFFEDLKYLKIIYDRTKADIYLMGNTSSFLPDYFLKKYFFVRGIIHNFFDEKIKDFLLKKEINCQSISYKIKKNRFILGKINYLKPLSIIKFKNPPQYHLFPLNRYSTPFIKKKPMTTMMTSFGCPFHCKFCVASSLSYYKRDFFDIKNEFEEIKKNKIKEIFFEDSTFNSYLDYTKNICQILIERKYNFSWSANLHSFNISKELLVLMKKAGCHTIKIGIESGNQETLKIYAPTKNLNKINQTIKLAKKVGLRVLGYFIIGFPNEDKKMATKTIDVAKKLDPDFASFSILTPDYGTDLYQEAISKKLIKKEIFNFDSSDKAILRNPYLSLKEQDKLIKKAYFDFYFQPKKIFQYFFDLKNLFLYFKNGVALFFKKIIDF